MKSDKEIEEFEARQAELAQVIDRAEYICLELKALLERERQLEDRVLEGLEDVELDQARTALKWLGFDLYGGAAGLLRKRDK